MVFIEESTLGTEVEQVGSGGNQVEDGAVEHFELAEVVLSMRGRGLSLYFFPSGVVQSTHFD